MNPFSGQMLIDEVRKRSFKFSGRSGEVSFDTSNGDRFPNFTILHKGRHKFEPFAFVYNDEKERLTFDQISKPNFNTPGRDPPPAEPRCGYSDTKCPRELQGGEIAAIISFISMIIIISGVGCIAFLQ
ncbi:unnamed protein product, partial [Owenia fusiformis]